ncbi:MAG: DUF86 domain-containing protein [Candidatus Paceibacterota bacterium]
MTEKRNIKLFIQDVFDAIEKINSYVSDIKNEKELKKDKKTYDAVIRNFTVIGESVKNIYEEVRQNYPNVEWKEIMAMRNLLVHEYWGIDEGVVWSAIKKNLPELKQIITKIESTLQK